MKALADKNASVGIHAARGLALMRDPRAGDALALKPGPDADPGIRWAAAEALGAIGSYLMQDSTKGDPEVFRNYLRVAFRAENSRPKPDRFMLDNLAVSLARLKDSEGLPRLQELEKDGDPVVREQARRAIEVLQGTPQK